MRTGSSAYPGAAVLGVEAAWRTGAGFVRYSGPTDVARLVLARRPETVTGAGPDARVGVWVVGSGTDAATRTPEEAVTLRRILTGSVPVVVDAGAVDLAASATAPLVATPHAGEFARMRRDLGLGDAGADRETAVVEVARALGGAVLLKGADTLVAGADGAVLRVRSRTHWLATAGTGDVLAGIIGALVAANPDAPLGACAAGGAWLHGRAAEVAAGVDEGVPGHPIVALDVAVALPAVIGEILRD